MKEVVTLQRDLVSAYGLGLRTKYENALDYIVLVVIRSLTNIKNRIYMPRERPSLRLVTLAAVHKLLSSMNRYLLCKRFLQKTIDIQ